MCVCVYVCVCILFNIPYKGLSLHVCSSKDGLNHHCQFTVAKILYNLQVLKIVNKLPSVVGEALVRKKKKKLYLTSIATSNIHSMAEEVDHTSERSRPDISTMDTPSRVF